MPVYGKCKICGKETRKRPSAVKRGEGQYCSAACRNIGRAVPIEVRFRQYVGPTTEAGCVLWIGCKNIDGYGKIDCRVRKRMVGAHRVAYELAHGPIPDGLHVLHRCDNPPCVNVEHLFLGTQADNNADMDAKGRRVSSHGERHRSAKLTEDLVREIRRRYSAGGISQPALAAEFGIDKAGICRLLNRKNWKHVL